MRLSEPEIKDTFFHQIDVRVKIVMLLCLSILSVALYHWQALLIVYIGVLLFVIVSRLSIQKLKALLIIVLLTAWSIMWVQAVFYNRYPKTPLIYLIPPGLVDPSVPLIGGLWEGLAIYYEGFIYGLQQSLRLIIPLTFGLLIFWTEDPVRILTGLTRLKLHYVISFMIMTCLRFIPLVMDEVRITLTSQRLRRYEPLKFHAIILGYGIYKTTMALIYPLLASSIRKAITMAKSADSRAFRAYNRRTELYEIKMRKIDLIILILFITVTIFVVVAKILFYLMVAELYYNEILTPIYWFTHYYL
ncbi:MAG TPA: energy-coupling factor transporter transmembrane protein EcfT [Archaeoglobus profundus]|nr:energy-coupling factor transporter transmembrane protein EcfT [Archaeoglobus profundus]